MPFVAEVLIALLPALLLFAALLAGRYPGERAIARLAGHARTLRRPRAPRAIGTARRAPRAEMPAGELLARSLATRPPPPLSA